MLHYGFVLATPKDLIAIQKSLTKAATLSFVKLPYIAMFSGAIVVALLDLLVFRLQEVLEYLAFLYPEKKYWSIMFYGSWAFLVVVCGPLFMPTLIVLSKAGICQADGVIAPSWACLSGQHLLGMVSGFMAATCFVFANIRLAKVNFDLPSIEFSRGVFVSGGDTKVHDGDLPIRHSLTVKAVQYAVSTKKVITVFTIGNVYISFYQLQVWRAFLLAVAVALGGFLLLQKTFAFDHYYDTGVPNSPQLPFGANANAGHAAFRGCILWIYCAQLLHVCTLAFGIDIGSVLPWLMFGGIPVIGWLTYMCRKRQCSNVGAELFQFDPGLATPLMLSQWVRADDDRAATARRVLHRQPV